MRRIGTGPATFALLIGMMGLPAAAQEGKINTRIPPPPPPTEELPVSRTLPEVFVAPLPPLPAVPAQVTLTAGTRIPVVLHTPLSTRITKKGDRVTFHTSHFLPISDGLELPPETEIVGTIVLAKKPGAFGKAGALQMKLERIELPTGTRANVQARLDSPDANGQGRISADRNSSANVADLAQWAIYGTLGGWQVAGGKGAGYGAATGAAIGLIIMASRKGPDLYLEPGMPFTIVLDRDVTLSGPEVQSVQMEYERRHGLLGNSSGANSAGLSVPMGEDGASRVDPNNRPVLKRRPR